MRAYLGHKNAIGDNEGVSLEIEPYGVSVFHRDCSINAHEYNFLFSKPKRLRQQQFITNAPEIAYCMIRTMEEHK